MRRKYLQGSLDTQQIPICATLHGFLRTQRSAFCSMVYPEVRTRIPFHCAPECVDSSAGLELPLHRAYCASSILACAWRTSLSTQEMLDLNFAFCCTSLRLTMDTPWSFRCTCNHSSQHGLVFSSQVITPAFLVNIDPWCFGILLGDLSRYHKLYSVDQCRVIQGSVRVADSSGITSMADRDVGEAQCDSHHNISPSEHLRARKYRLHRSDRHF